MSEDTQTEIKADTAAGVDTPVTLAPEAAAAAAAEKAKEPTAQDKLNVLLARQKEFHLSMKEELEISRLRKTIKAQTRSRKAQRSMFEEYFLKPQKKSHQKMMKQVRVVRDQIGRQDFRMLRDIFTQVTPEQKDEVGNVLQPASAQVNYPALLAEAKNVMVMQREHRIKAGLRKRTTGRSSDRATHKSTLDFLLKRNAEETVKAAQEEK